MILFISLVMDLLAFTVILPLLPTILEHYETAEYDFLYDNIKAGVSGFKHLVGIPESEKWNSVLFGGIVGSMFSYLQFISSPTLGALSDVHGRRPLMIITSIVIALSYLLWAFSTSFTVFMLARIIGGISKGNVSLSTVIVGDVTSSSKRSKGMAVVGVAFSIGFLIGPLIGAWFSIRSSQDFNQFFVFPAIYAFVLASLNVLFIILFLKESLPVAKRVCGFINYSLINPFSLFNFSAVNHVSKNEKEHLKRIGLVYFMYLFIYSGLEFTLTFLTHQRFAYTSMQQGRMFLVTGLIMIIVHGTAVRKVEPGKELEMARNGILILIPSFILVGMASNQVILYLGLVLFSYASATVVSCLTSETSRIGREENKGTIMGVFRSLGALARALGPFLAAIAYWYWSPMICYMVGAFLLILPCYLLGNVKSKVN
ncbi:hypothetical protein HELRODRAFT_186668 [Helobdella robusta]|uniref:Major facilitator superfamily (MFS) profile domain-containing protein n=1 Tax=Helobdella robusta TaxID=6412 RepID=T1FP21_HELRO|nr:hypothetical protein HELRODRAFT_186668 [Helobdella robusta]ESO10778.1 hypothetical protein HELRODRAFT_186668 [Helobdella robusta]